MTQKGTKDLLLVTTALEETWGNEEEILFLGEWCKLYSRRHTLTKRKNKTISYHWDDRDKLKIDESRLNCLHDQLINSLTKTLNKIHDVNYPNRYWQMILDPWLVSYLAVIWDRWECMQVALNKYNPTKTFLLNEDTELEVPRDYSSAIELYLDDLWNHHLFADILSIFKSKDCQICHLDNLLQNLSTSAVDVASEPTSIKWRIAKFLDNF